MIQCSDSSLSLPDLSDDDMFFRPLEHRFLSTLKLSPSPSWGGESQEQSQLNLASHLQNIRLEVSSEWPLNETQSKGEKSQIKQQQQKRDQKTFRKSMPTRKNMIRNIHNFFKHYVNSNPCSQLSLEGESPNSLEAREVRCSLERSQLNSFQDFKHFWESGPSNLRSLFEIWLQKQAITYILNSKISRQVRREYLHYLFRFVEGIQEPTRFNRFKTFHSGLALHLHPPQRLEVHRLVAVRVVAKKLEFKLLLLLFFQLLAQPRQILLGVDSQCHSDGPGDDLSGFGLGEQQEGDVPEVGLELSELEVHLVHEEEGVEGREVLESGSRLVGRLLVFELFHIRMTFQGSILIQHGLPLRPQPHRLRARPPPPPLPPPPPPPPPPQHPRLPTQSGLGRLRRHGSQVLQPIVALRGRPRHGYRQVFERDSACSAGFAVPVADLDFLRRHSAGPNVALVPDVCDSGLQRRTSQKGQKQILVTRSLLPKQASPGRAGFRQRAVPLLHIFTALLPRSASDPHAHGPSGRSPLFNKEVDECAATHKRLYQTGRARLVQKIEERALNQQCLDVIIQMHYQQRTSSLLEDFKDKLRHQQFQTLKPVDPNRPMVQKPSQKKLQSMQLLSGGRQSSSLRRESQRNLTHKQEPHETRHYESDIINYISLVEQQYVPREDFISRQPELNSSMRAVLVDWLVDVSAKFKFSPQTIFLTVNLIDRYLSAKHVSRRRFQLLGVSAALVAAKVEEIYAPQIKDLVYVTDYAFSKEDILEMQGSILSVLGFNLNYVSPLQFLYHFNKARPSDSRSLNFAKYILELSLLHVQFSCFGAKDLALTALVISKRVLKAECAQRGEALKVSRLVDMLVREKESRLSAVRRKFSSESLGAVSQLCLQLKG